MGYDKGIDSRLDATVSQSLLGLGVFWAGSGCGRRGVRGGRMDEVGGQAGCKIAANKNAGLKGKRYWERWWCIG